MNIDINFQLAYYTSNVNVIDLFWKTYGTAFWYDTRIETYHAAMVRAKDAVWEEVYTDFPHLKGKKFKYTESEEFPTIDINEM